MAHVKPVAHVPLYDYDTPPVILLRRARDVLADMSVLYDDDREIRDLEYDIDTYLAEVARGAK